MSISRSHNCIRVSILLACVLSGGRAALAAQRFAPNRVPTPVGSPLGNTAPADSGSGPRSTSAPVSKLPVPAGSEIWVDVEGSGPIILPAPGLNTSPVVQRSSVLVVHPRGDALAWEEWLRMFHHAGMVAENAAPLLRSSTPATAAAPGGPPAPPTGEYRVYGTRVATEFLVLGIQKDPKSGQQQVSAVLFSGRMDRTQALTQAQSLIAELTARAVAARGAVPVPAGAIPAAQEIRFSGAQLRSMLTGILQDPSVSPRVKEMSRVVLPQATSLRFSVWRTREYLSDASFFDFYTQQGARLGWGQPLTRDETQPNHPALLFQRPNNDGVVMVRAQPSSMPRGAASRVPAHIFVLVIEGKIDASSLATR